MPGHTHSASTSTESASPGNTSAVAQSRGIAPFYKVGYAMSGYNPFTISSDVVFDKDLVIERPLPGNPHRGRVFAAVQAHADDVPLYCAGLLAKLVHEGYTGHIIRMTNEDMSGPGKEYPEFRKAGIEGHAVGEKYYYPRSPQGHNVVNRVVDISAVIDEKVNANLASLNFGPAGNNGSLLRQRLAEEGKRLPILGNTDSEADFNYIKELLMEDWRALGKEFGLEYAEAYHYIGPSHSGNSSVQEYVDRNAVALE